MDKREINPELRSRYGRVAVLMGGGSAERVISLETGRAVHMALLNSGVDAHALDARGNFMQQLLELECDRVFIALHGRGGEDGLIQGALETLGIPYTGSGVAGSALAMDKIHSKIIWKFAGLPTPDFMMIREEKDLLKALEVVGSPLMVKPVHEGSSCGASKVTDATDISRAWKTASQYQDQVMAEKWINGSEYTAAVLNQEVLPLIKLETPHEFYDYKAKYEVDSTRYICPCGLAPEDEKEVQKTVMEAFNALGASGWGRVDLFIDEYKQVWLIELNTVPGMTSHSLVPMAAKEVGKSFDELVLEILDTTLVEKNMSRRASA